jgi:hypothetical protein
MADTTKCPKRSGTMEEGFPHCFGWLPLPWNSSLATRFKAALWPMVTRGLKCRDCGFLEFYAVAPQQKAP